MCRYTPVPPFTSVYTLSSRDLWQYRSRRGVPYRRKNSNTANVAMTHTNRNNGRTTTAAPLPELVSMIVTSTSATVSVSLSFSLSLSLSLSRVLSLSSRSFSLVLSLSCPPLPPSVLGSSLGQPIQSRRADLGYPGSTRITWLLYFQYLLFL